MRLKMKHYFISVFLVIVLFSMSVIYGNQVNETQFSKKYQEWLELPEEEREGTIAPLPFNVREENKGLANSVWSFFTSVRIPDRYDLRDYIDYIEVKDQMSTGQCWAFSANSSVETYLALNERRNI